jgi:hypothetical protein
MDSVLSLSTEKKEHKVIEVDGEKYELATLDDLSFKESSYMSWASNRIQELIKGTEWSDEKGEELQNLLHETCKLLLPDMPEEVYSKINDNQRLQIFNVFNEQEGVAGEAPPQSSDE